ncbi:MAG TPA: coniferyl aldehyde dehydrogenase [Steroidobacteraceae bacterium]|nr:coniferyl aldehyde dehydrogenase [Steroidobacteraceae bacterium]
MSTSTAAVTIERMHATLAAQRAAFARHPRPSAAERKAKLRALRALLRKHQQAIVEAVDADFGGRASTETRLIEVLGPILEANHAISHLARWMRPRRRHTELLFATNRAWVEYQPKGVVGIIVPWNFPVYLALGPLVAALAAGNRAMIKMSELAPRTTEAVARMLREAFPEEEVAVFGGDIEEAQAFGRLPFDHLIFTGSPAVGRHVMRAAADHLVPVTLELGGKSPAIIGRGADLADAAKRVAHGKAFSGGQICVAPDYALVPRESLEEFTSAVVAAYRRMYPQVQGNLDQTGIVSDRHAERVRGLVADAEQKGARVIAAGDSGPGRRLPLTVITEVRDEMAIAREEIFGPVLPVIPYDTVQDALDYVQSRPRPLALYAFGFAGDELRGLIEQTHAGGMSINDWGWHPFQHDLPFGGIGNSGMGTYHGEEGFRELSHAKGIFKRHRFFPIGLFYPPYGSWVQRLALGFYLGKSPGPKT